MKSDSIHYASSELLARVIKEDLVASRFEALSTRFAIQDNDPDRARNHALWAARLANRAVRRFAAFIG